ncbi:MAG: CCA tRNA nucleotidyltransferase, partial [Pseudomonadota bacterium]
MIHLSIPEPVRFILERLGEHQFKSYVVGGAVRDAILGKNPEDMDVLTSAGLEQIKKIFSDQAVKVVGQTFPVCLVNGIEVAAPRKSKEKVSFPESDLACRDLTINAMAWDPDTRELIDPYAGQADLENRVIRFTLDPE